MSIILVDHLHKSFRTHSAPPSGGAKNRFSQFFSRAQEEVVAVDDISFEMKKGERVAFVGPNGAGKSTTMKILTGILAPTRGSTQVLGLEPWKSRRKLGYQIGTVFGQRSQLWQHLPAQDTFELLAKVYRQDPALARKRRTELVESFDVGRLLHKPVNQLSLGEKMKCELIASLLHAPKILFLDEPTIGLDVTAKATIRDLIKARSEEEGVTLLLTSHDTGDIENVCDRIIIIHHGRIVIDQPLSTLKSRILQKKHITLVTAKDTFHIELKGVKVVQHVPHRFVLEVDTKVIPIEEVIQFALKSSSLHDITVEDPPMEEIIAEIYGETKGLTQNRGQG